MEKEQGIPTVSILTAPLTKYSPQPVAGRVLTSRFRKRYFHFCTENLVLGVCLVPIAVFGQMLWNLPALLKLRALEKKRVRDPENPRVYFWTDTLDEVNGIANNIRLTVKAQMNKGRKAHLIGAVHRSREGGRVENSYVMLFPLFFAMPQLGYPDSELSAPQMGAIIRWFRRYPPDVIELDTPNPGSWVVAIIGKFMGIPVVSHYRTDANGYTRLLVKSKLMQRYVHFLVFVFSRFTTPVITPSRDFQEIVKREMWLKDSDVVRLPRGIDLANFSPTRRTAGFWPQFNRSAKAVRFLFVGRVSLEKALPFLEDVWREFRMGNDNAELMIVGNGPYLEQMKSNLADCPDVSFTGQLSGEPLFSLYAEADFFVFTSGNDTFGNVIVESLASGTPTLISNRGGPKDIVEGTDCGIVIPFLDKDAWVQGLRDACISKLASAESYEALRQRCFERSRLFSLDNACDAQWEFMKSLARKG